jgi:MoaA/NifB/PqqE/SkfB family radical SAM enzyme
MGGSREYGFQGHLSADFPSQIVIDTTEVCNLACIHCPHEMLTQRGVLSKKFINVELHNRLIDEVAECGRNICRYLRYTGQGETLLHPNILDMLEYAANKSGTSINLTTNGTILWEKRSQRILDAGVHAIDISIDAFNDKTYAMIRKKGQLSITRKNVQRLIELRTKGRYGTKVVVSFVEQPLNASEINEFENYWNEQGADYVVIRRQHSAGGVKCELVDVKAERYPCLYPWERLTIGPSGMIHYCPQDWVHGSEIADYRVESIRQVWVGEKMSALREAHLSNDFSTHSYCGNCPDWSTTRWPTEGKSYSDLMHKVSQASSEE